MSIKHLFGRGIGFNAAGISWIVTRGYGSGAAAPVFDVAAAGLTLEPYNGLLTLVPRDGALSLSPDAGALDPSPDH